MIVKCCDECHTLLIEESPNMIVALRDDKRQTIAFRKVGESGAIGKVSCHFCNHACAALYFEKWLEGVLPPMLEIEVPEVAPASPSRPLEVRLPTQQERADQNSVIMSVLGSG